MVSQCLTNLRMGTGVLQGMNMNPGMMNMMKDLNGDEMNKQLETLGLSPSEVINKIMAEPDLAAAFQKPKVMQARGACLSHSFPPLVPSMLPMAGPC